MQKFIKMAEEACMPAMDSVPQFGVGDIINAHLKVTENNKARIQQYQGIVVEIKGRKDHIRTVVLRKITPSGVAVERIIPIPSPNVQRIEVLREAKVRRANLSYLRKLKGTKTKVKYKIS